MTTTPRHPQTLQHHLQTAEAHFPERFCCKDCASVIDEEDAGSQGRSQTPDPAIAHFHVHSLSARLHTLEAIRTPTTAATLKSSAQYDHWQSGQIAFLLANNEGFPGSLASSILQMSRTALLCTTSRRRETALGPEDVIRSDQIALREAERSACSRDFQYARCAHEKSRERGAAQKGRFFKWFERDEEYLIDTGICAFSRLTVQSKR